MSKHYGLWDTDKNDWVPFCDDICWTPMKWLAEEKQEVLNDPAIEIRDYPNEKVWEWLKKA